MILWSGPFNWDRLCSTTRIPASNARLGSLPVAHGEGDFGNPGVSLPKDRRVIGVGGRRLLVRPHGFVETAPAGGDCSLVQLHRRKRSGIRFQLEGFLVCTLGATPILHFPKGGSQVVGPESRFRGRVEPPGRIQGPTKIRDRLAELVLYQVEPSGFTEDLCQPRTGFHQPQSFPAIRESRVEVTEVGIAQAQVVRRSGSHLVGFQFVPDFQGLVEVRDGLVAARPPLLNHPQIVGGGGILKKIAGLERAFPGRSKRQFRLIQALPGEHLAAKDIDLRSCSRQFLSAGHAPGLLEQRPRLGGVRLVLPQEELGQQHQSPDLGSSMDPARPGIGFEQPPGAAHVRQFQPDLRFQQAELPIPLGFPVIAPRSGGPARVTQAFLEGSLTEQRGRPSVSVLRGSLRPSIRSRHDQAAAYQDDAEKGPGRHQGIQLPFGSPSAYATWASTSEPIARRTRVYRRLYSLIRTSPK